MEEINLTKKNRKEMIEFLENIKSCTRDEKTLKMVNRIEKELSEKKFGIVFEEHREEVDDLLQTNIPVLCEDAARRICKDKDLPWNFIIEGDNLQALYLLLKTHRGKVNCIYIDPPYNTGARDWKYNNDYVDINDGYRHSKWLSMMKVRLELAKQLLNPENSVLIVTIDENEYHHLGCMLEELFPEAKIQMISSVINPKGAPGAKNFFRVEEYIYFVQIGEARPQKLALSEDFRMNASDRRVDKLIRWQGLAKTQYTREHAPGCFYPIYVSEDLTHIVEIGDPIGKGVDRNSIPKKNGCITVWPINKSKGTEAQWSLSAPKLRENLSKGYVRVAKGSTAGIYYLTGGVIKEIEKGDYKIIGRDADGSIIIDESNYEYKFVPGTVWRVTSHDATRNGSDLITKILPGHHFPFPKSLYAVHDALRFFVANNPDALIIDFFAGSGTTMHAVSLLNAEDGGKRRCIMVTNNEISSDEEMKLKKSGYKKGDEEWEKLGIAKYITWPRMECSINGIDINGNPLSGNYLATDSEGNEISMSDGFKTNVKYFKCDWTPRKPEEYFLSNVLMLHIKEMIELENAIEIDNSKNVLILNKEDYNKYIDDENVYKNIENIWVNQKIIFDPAEIGKMKKKNFKYIPTEYFGQELKDVAE